MNKGEQNGKKKLRKEHESQTQDRSDQGKEKYSRQFIVLPCMKGVTEHLRTAVKKHGVRLYSKAGYTVRNAVVSPTVAPYQKLKYRPS